MIENKLDPKLPLIQNADFNNKVVLLRVDHNVVKKGVIKDPYRIDSTVGTIFYILSRGGKPILMTHVGRPRDKKTGNIKIEDSTSVKPIADYLRHKLHASFPIPEYKVHADEGITVLDTSMQKLISLLNERKIGGIYLPNTRWFTGEQSKDDKRKILAKQLAGLADLYVNDAFGSWQPHCSTYDVTMHIPSYAGFLMQKELTNLNHVLEPTKPFLGVVAGSKFDTKIGPIKQMYSKVDYMILGGVVYNAYLCAKYDIQVQGVTQEDINAAKELVHEDSNLRKIVELPIVIESDVLDQRVESKFRNRNINEFQAGNKYNYFLDVAPESFQDSRLDKIVLSAKTIFVNAVMGYTPNFSHGSKKLFQMISKNENAKKLFGGGDTLQELKTLCPGIYMTAMDDPNYYFFTGGGAVLKAIEQDSPYGLKPVTALMDTHE